MLPCLSSWPYLEYGFCSADLTWFPSWVSLSSRTLSLTFSAASTQNRLFVLCLTPVSEPQDQASAGRAKGGLACRFPGMAPVSVTILACCLPDRLSSPNCMSGGGRLFCYPCSPCSSPPLTPHPPINKTRINLCHCVGRGGQVQVWAGVARSKNRCGIQTGPPNPAHSVWSSWLPLTSP